MRTTVHIQNLKCEGCQASILRKLSRVKNISEVEVHLIDASVSFNYHTSHDFERAKDILEMMGYPIFGKENKLQTKAKSYVSCAIGRVNSKKQPK